MTMHVVLKILAIETAGDLFAICLVIRRAHAPDTALSMKRMRVRSAQSQSYLSIVLDCGVYRARRAVFSPDCREA